jgi:hypothetical protein
MRRKRLRISTQWLTDCLSGRCQFPGILRSDYPADSKIVWVDWIGYSDCIMLVIENKAFPIVPLGDKLPELNVTFTRTEAVA